MCLYALLQVFDYTMKPLVPLLALVILFHISQSEAKSKHVTVELDAKWHHTPILLEVR